MNICALESEFNLSHFQDSCSNSVLGFLKHTGLSRAFLTCHFLIKLCSRAFQMLLVDEHLRFLNGTSISSFLRCVVSSLDFKIHTTPADRMAELVLTTSYCLSVQVPRHPPICRNYHPSYIPISHNKFNNHLDFLTMSYRRLYHYAKLPPQTEV